MTFCRRRWQSEMQAFRALSRKSKIFVLLSGTLFLFYALFFAFIRSLAGPATGYESLMLYGYPALLILGWCFAIVSLRLGVRILLSVFLLRILIWIIAGALQGNVTGTMLDLLPLSLPEAIHCAALAFLLIAFLVEQKYRFSHFDDA